jgi:hypothetical protein
MEDMLDLCVDVVTCGWEKLHQNPNKTNKRFCVQDLEASVWPRCHYPQMTIQCVIIPTY